MKSVKTESKVKMQNKFNANDEMFPIVQKLFSAIDVKTLKRIIIDGHVANLKETIDFFDCDGSEIRNLASINYTLLDFLDEMNDMYEKRKKTSQIEAIAE